MNTQDLQFNIIYTPDTVKYLSPFVHSLMKWSDSHFRLVANGCGSEERQYLNDLCAGNDRLQYLCISEDGMIDHGRSLNLLQKDHAGEWFCALDSDILATGNFTDELVRLSSSNDVISSCLPVWAIKGDDVLRKSFSRLQGTHVKLEDGLTIGTTYFLLYRNKLVNEIRSSLGVGFERYYWDKIPAEHQETIRTLGVEKTDYDTAIVFNLLLTARGGKVAYTALENLIHLGGISIARKNSAVQFRRGPVDLPALKLQKLPIADALMWCADLFYGNKNIVEDCSKAEYINLASRARRRTTASQYFYTLLHALVDGGELPPVPYMASRITERKLAAAADAVESAFKEAAADR